MDLISFLVGSLFGVILTSIIFIFVYKLLSAKLELKLNKSTNESVLNTLQPLKEKIEEYQRTLGLNREKDIEHNAILRTELKHMIEMSRQMEEETKALTLALKGDVKAQGDWGEIILERTLEISGLENGREFSLQGNGMGLKGEEGNLLKPDAIIHLPGDNHVIVDSKVSLKSLKEENIKDLKKSLTSHIDGLSSKGYQKLDGLNSPEFVIMFIPLEGIMPIIFKEFPEILEYASRKNIVISTPISLLPILKTISGLWRLEKQNKNSVEIAKKAGQLYDKFVTLYDGLQSTGEMIARLQVSHQESLKRLSDGKGNILSRVDELKELGAKTSKEL